MPGSLCLSQLPLTHPLHFLLPFFLPLSLLLRYQSKFNPLGLPLAQYRPLSVNLGVRNNRLKLRSVFTTPIFLGNNRNHFVGETLPLDVYSRLWHNLTQTPRRYLGELGRHSALHHLTLARRSSLPLPPRHSALPSSISLLAGRTHFVIYSSASSVLSF